MCILVVEDEFLIRMILVEELVEAGYEVVEAATGDDAIELLERTAGIKAVVTDIHMPGSHSGLHVAAHVQERQPDVPVIFTTGRPDALVSDRGLPAGQYLVRKPYVAAEIIRCIKQALTGSQA